MKETSSNYLEKYFHFNFLTVLKALGLNPLKKNNEKKQKPCKANCFTVLYCYLEDLNQEWIFQSESTVYKMVKLSMKEF